jgi:hypothetical protein
MVERNWTDCTSQCVEGTQVCGDGIIYNYHNSEHYPSSCLLFKTQRNSIGLSVPHRKHITSPLRAQQVNAIYRFVTMVY